MLDLDYKKKKKGQNFILYLEKVICVWWIIVPSNLPSHSSVLWRIPGTGEPGGLPPMGSHRVVHDWSDLAAAAATCLPQKLLELSYLEQKDLPSSHIFRKVKAKVMLVQEVSCIPNMRRISYNHYSFCSLNWPWKLLISYKSVFQLIFHWTCFCQLNSVNSKAIMHGKFANFGPFKENTC